MYMPVERQLDSFHILNVDPESLSRIVQKEPMKNDWTPLHYACFVGDVRLVENILGSGRKVDIDAKGPAKHTPLQVAAARAHVGVTMMLLQKGAKVKGKDKNGWTPLHYACRGGNPIIVSEILKKGAPTKDKSKIGWTALHCACVGGFEEVVDMLLCMKGINVNDRDEAKNTPLHYAAASGSIRIVDKLLSKEGRLESVNLRKQSPFHFACHIAGIPMIQFLIEKGADINAQTWEDKRAPLHNAVEKGQVELCTVLVAANADVNIKERDDWTPLHIAFNMGFTHLAILLLSKGADFGAKERRGQIPLAFPLNKFMDNFLREFLLGNLPMDMNFWPTTRDRISQLTRLPRVADFSGTGLYGFPPGFAFIAFVNALDLSNNRITYYPDNLASFNHLKRLSLAKNNLSQFPEHLLSLPVLSSLDLSDNNLTELPFTIVKMHALSSLNINNNKLQMLPTFLVELTALEIHFEGNPLNCIPPQIKSKGYKDILIYLKQLKEGAAPWGRMKLMFVGQEGVGKTSLLQSIQQKTRADVTQLLSTDGIEISSFVTNKVQFRAWDFGGQLVFYPTHQFFLTKGCVYLVLFDATKPNSLDRVEYWLQQLRCLAFEDPRSLAAIVIATHVDKEKSNTLVNGELQATPIDIAQRRFPPNRYPFIRGFMQVSCRPKKQHGVTQVVEKLLELSKADKTFCSFVPESWIHLESKLMQMVNNGIDYIEWPIYSEVGKSCNIAAEDLDFVTQFMHDAGVLLHFQGNSTKSVFWNSGLAARRVGGLIVLNPQWLANVMASIVTFSHTWVKYGILFHSDLTQLWKEKYPPELWDLLLGLLEDFEVLYPLQLQNGATEYKKYLVPSLLPTISSQTPEPVEITFFEKMWSDFPQFNLRRVYSWDTLPMGFFPRLLIRVAHISQWATRGWVDGVTISHGPHLVFIRYVEGTEVGGMELPRGTFHLELRVARDPDNHHAVELAPMLAQLSHSICALRDTAYRQYTSFSSIYCHHCLRTNAANKTMFSYQECMDSMIQNNPLTCPNCPEGIHLEELAPDIAFANVPLIRDDQLELGAILGQGGFGKVYKGTLTDSNHGKVEVAIKEAIDLKYEEDFQMLQHEVFLMSTIKHPNLVLFYGIARHPTMQIVMEFVPGNDLSKLLRVNEATALIPPYEWQLRIIYDVACAMMYLHGLSPPITHRDLRSPNILVLNNDPESPILAKVIDMGLAQQLAPITYGALETWQWLAPEIILPTVKSSFTEKCDVYSFGICIWEIMAQGKMPFEEYLNEYQVLLLKEKIAKGNLRPTIPSTTPPELVQVIRDCWHSDPNQRPSFSQLAPYLERLLLGRKVNMEARKANFSKYLEQQTNVMGTIRFGSLRALRTAAPDMHKSVVDLLDEDVRYKSM